MKTIFPLLHLLLIIIFSWERNFAFAQNSDSSKNSIISKFTQNEQTAPINNQNSLIGYSLSPHQFVTLGAIRIYQTFNHSLKLISCPMYPSCSEYGYLAFKTYNPLKASLKLSDRLLRCGHDLDNYSIIETDGVIRFKDPFINDSNQKHELLTQSEIQKQQKLNCVSFNLLPLTLSSSSDSNNENNRIFNFAQSLMEERDYDRAITEFKRILFYYPNSSNHIVIIKLIFHCYTESQQYQEAIDFGKEIINKNLYSTYKNEIEFLIGVCYLKLGNYPFARNYSLLSQSSKNNDVIDKSYLLEGLSYTHETQWQNAIQSFSKISSTSNYFQTAQNYGKLSQAAEQLPYKNPSVAGFLAVLPGLGYYYDGYKQTAITAFLMNGIISLSTVLSFQKNNEGIGVMFSTFNIAMYVGNIYGSIISARRRNLKIQKDYLDKFNLDFDF